MGCAGDRAGAGGRYGGRGRGGEQRLGEDHHRGHTALLLLAQLHPDAVPVGEAGHDVQAEAQTLVALVARLVGGLGIEVGEAGVEGGHPLGGHADALVLHGEHDLAALQEPAGDLDGQVGRGERGGVLHQFGQQVREVVRGEAGHVGVRRQGGDTDPLVALDLADGGPYDIDQRDRARALLHVFRTGEDEEVLAVAAHDRGEVVELEEGRQALRVLLALLQALDDG